MIEDHSHIGNGRDGAAGASPAAELRRWSSRVVVLFTLGGVAGAVIAYLAIAASWGGCQDELEAGGRFTVNFLGIAALMVMPLVGAASGGLAMGVNGLLRSSTRLSKLSDIVPALIMAVGAMVLVILIVVWIAVGNPPEGYCDRTLG